MYKFLVLRRLLARSAEFYYPLNQAIRLFRHIISNSQWLQIAGEASICN